MTLDSTVRGGADTWLRLQAAYDLTQAVKHADKIKVDRLSPIAVMVLRPSQGELLLTHRNENGEGFIVASLCRAQELLRRLAACRTFGVSPLFSTTVLFSQKL